MPQTYFRATFGVLQLFWGVGPCSRASRSQPRENNRKFLSPGRPTKVSCVYPENQEKQGVWVSGAEIQTSAVDTRTAVWVFTAEKIFSIVLGETRNVFSKL